MELIVISKEIYFKTEGKIINKLFNNGLNIFHLRKQDVDKARLVDLLHEIDPVFHCRIALHQFHHIAPDFGITRLHYSERLRRESLPFPQDNTLSTSIHSWDSISEIGQFNYAFFSPVFDSLSKPGYQGSIIPGFRIPETEVSIVALGGINYNNARQIINMGFKGMALLGALWNDPLEAVDNFKKIQALC